MSLSRITSSSALWAFISAKLAIVLAIIAISGGLLAYEWHRADSVKTRDTPAHHHGHHHDRHLAIPH